MRRAWISAVFIGLASDLAIFAAEGNGEAGKKALQQACQPCHSLRLVETQRLSAAAWQKEVDKMIGWGAVVPDREVLMDYLNEHYNNTATLPTAVMSAAKTK